MSMPKWLSLVMQFAPLALMGTPLAPIGPAIGGFMAEARQLPGATGQQMNDHVVNMALLAADGYNTEQSDASKHIDLDFIRTTGPQIFSSIVNITHEVHRIQGHDPVAPPVAAPTTQSPSK